MIEQKIETPRLPVAGQQQQQQQAEEGSKVFMQTGFLRKKRDRNKDRKLPSIS